MPSLHHQHRRTHQRAHGHALTPVPHQSSTILPAPPVMGTRDSSFNTLLPRGAKRPCPAPVTAFHRATHPSFRSPEGARWAALHVSIAWKIYYHKQLQKLQQKADSVYGEMTPECSAGTSLPGSEQPSRTHLNPDSPCGHRGIGSEAGTHQFNRSHPASCHSHTTTQREKQEQLPNLHRQEKADEKEKPRVHPAATTGASPLRDQPRDRTVTAELDRKRQLERDSFIRAKRVKKEPVEDDFDSSTTFHTDPSPFSLSHAHRLSRTTPVQHMNISHLSLLYPDGSRCSVSTAPAGPLSYPGAVIYPHQTWEPLWDVHKRKDVQSRQDILRDYSLNTCKAQRQTGAFSGFFMPPLYVPLALGVQDTANLREREFLQPPYENCQPHHCRSRLRHPGFLASSCLRP